MEKFYHNALWHNMIPVVINRGDFNDPTVAPPGCCIKASDFKGARELTEYMKKVANNITLFNSYFNWHSTYTVREDLLAEVLYTVREDLLAEVFCRACHKLHTDAQTKVYDNLYGWFGIRENCIGYHYRILMIGDE